MARRPLKEIIASFALLIGVLTASGAQAQAPYPNQSIKFLGQAPAAGLPDTVARIVARRLQEQLGQSVVVENRPGANGGVAAATLPTAPAQGSPLMWAGGAAAERQSF